MADWLRKEIIMHKMVNGERVEIPEEEAIVIQAEWDKNKDEKAEKKRLYGYIKDRENAYPPVGDQLDVLISYIKLKADASGDMLELIDQIDAIKLLYPKPE